MKGGGFGNGWVEKKKKKKRSRRNDDGYDLTDHYDNSELYDRLLKTEN